jgi:uncharacterized protein YqeY
MGIFDDVVMQMTAAMKAKDAARLTALRGIRAAFLNETKKDNAKSLADDICTSLLRRLEKQRNESIEAFEAAGRPDRAAEERAELAVIQEFLPRLADAAQTQAWVVEAVATTHASKPGDVGRVMAAVMKAHKGEVDGTLARKIASELLGG